MKSRLSTRKIVKKIAMGVFCLIVGVTCLPVNAQAAESLYYRMSNSQSYHYTFKVEKTNYIQSLYLVDWCEHYKGISETLYIEEDTTYTAVCSASISTALSTSMGFESEVPGFNANASIEASVEATAGLEASASKSFKRGYSATIPSSKTHAFYALEMFEYGDALKMTWTRCNLDGKNKKTKTASIKFYPAGLDMPGKRMKRYSTPNLAGNYKDYKKLWKES